MSIQKYKPEQIVRLLQTDRSATNLLTITGE